MIMKKKGVLLTAVILLSTAGVTWAQTGELHGMAEVTYQSKYVWRGFDIYGDKSAIQPAIGLDLFGTGWGITAVGHRANASGFEEGERYDYGLYYGNTLFGQESYAVNYRLGWVYYNFPDLKSSEYDLQEANLILSCPKVCPAGVVPTYVLVKMWPSNSGSMVGHKSPSTGTASGWAHIFMLDYPLPVEGLVPEIPEHILNLHAEVVWNEGIGPGGSDVDQDWSNAVFGVSTDFDLGYNLTFTPAVYYQVTMEKTVNDDQDETWATLGLKYKF
jgi:hypothetical protein